MGVLSLLTEVQLSLMPKSVRWVAVSEFNRACLVRLGFENVQVCPCVVTTGKPNGSLAKASPIKTPEPSVLFVGRLAPSKNPLELVEQAMTCGKQLGTRLILRIVGDVKPGCPYGEAFRQRVLGLPAEAPLSIEWYSDALQEERLDELYASSWLYVSMSSHEGFGLPACEAVVRGTPALYLECGGTESILGQLGMVRLAERREFWRHMATLLLIERERNVLLQKQQEIAVQYTRPLVDSTIRKIYGPLLDL